MVIFVMNGAMFKMFPVAFMQEDPLKMFGLPEFVNGDLIPFNEATQFVNVVIAVHLTIIIITIKE